MSTLTRMPRTQLLAAMALVIVIAELFANDIFGDADVGGWISLSLFGIAVMLLLVLVLVPRIPADKRRAWTLGLGVAAVVSCVVFWSALPFALAAATFPLAASGGAHLGESADASPSAGVILAALATLAAFIFCIIG